MNSRKLSALIISLALMAGTAGALIWLKDHKRLGPPGIKATPIPETLVMNIGLPATPSDFTSTNLEPDKVVLDYLPKDTSFARRRYFSADGPPIEANIILMGTDRTSIHKAEYCLTGAGLTMDRKTNTTITISGPQPYDLPVAKWFVSRVDDGPNGQKVKVSGVYVFWFVTDGEMTPNYRLFQVMLAWDLLHTGVLKRWAYVSYYVPCAPGEEEAAFERGKRLIAASVPEFQLPPRKARSSAVAHQ
jgi:Protein of unknown function (DUF3485)